MSRWSLAALVLAAACGGSSPKSPEPIGNMAPMSQEPVVEPSGPSDPSGPSGGTSDHDGDGLADSGDACPADPEDFDAFEDDDGCPDPDNDHDGILDVDDLCPNEPEDRDGYQDEDGCPDP